MTRRARILAFGDSLTWGRLPGRPDRHGDDVRWPRVLEKALGGYATVIEEGLNGRRIALEDPLRPYRSGMALLPLFLESHAPLDLVILMLGTNDCQRQHSLSAFDVARSMRALAQLAQRPPVEPGMPVPEVLIVSPPLVRKPDDPGHEAHFVMEGAPEKMAQLAGFYRRIADEIGASFFDAAAVATVSGEDGIHLDAQNTRAIGLALAPVVDGLLGLPLPTGGPARQITQSPLPEGTSHG
jgi:lysophospholipase L1-like esterase